MSCSGVTLKLKDASRMDHRVPAWLGGPALDLDEEDFCKNFLSRFNHGRTNHHFRFV